VEEKAISICYFFFEEFDQIFLCVEKEQKSTVSYVNDFGCFELLDYLSGIFILAPDHLDRLGIIHLFGYVQVEQLLVG